MVEVYRYIDCVFFINHWREQNNKISRLDLIKKMLIQFFLNFKAEISHAGLVSFNEMATVLLTLQCQHINSSQSQDPLTFSMMHSSRTFFVSGQTQQGFNFFPSGPTG